MTSLVSRMKRRSGSTLLSGSAPTTTSSSPSRSRPISLSGKPVSTVKRTLGFCAITRAIDAGQVPAEPGRSGADAGVPELAAGDADHLGAGIGELRLDQLDVPQQSALPDSVSSMPRPRRW